MHVIRLFLFFLFVVPLMLSARQNTVLNDPVAARILKAAAEKAISKKSVRADFDLTIEDRKLKTKNTFSGRLFLKHNKYRVETADNQVMFDGKTMWTYTPKSAEVVITEPGSSENDFLSNPSQFFTSYTENFKFKYVREVNLNNKQYHEIDLYPKNLAQPYIRIKVFIPVTGELPEILTMNGKDGVDHSIHLRYRPAEDIADALFVFDKAKAGKVEVIDMRGLK